MHLYKNKWPSKSTSPSGHAHTERRVGVRLSTAHRVVSCNGGQQIDRMFLHRQA
jgi:hypothetical protein